MIVIFPGRGVRVFEHGGDPDGADAEIVEIVELGGYAGEGAALAETVFLIPGARGRGGGVVEAVDHEEIEPIVTPVRRGGKRIGNLFGLAVDLYCFRRALLVGGLDGGERGFEDRVEDAGVHGEGLFLLDRGKQTVDNLR